MPKRMRSQKSEQKERLVYVDYIRDLNELIERRRARIVWVSYPITGADDDDNEIRREEWYALGYCETCGKTVFEQTDRKDGEELWMCQTCGAVYTTGECLDMGITYVERWEREVCQRRRA